MVKYHNSVWGVWCCPCVPFDRRTYGESHEHDTCPRQHKSSSRIAFSRVPLFLKNNMRKFADHLTRCRHAGRHAPIHGLKLGLQRRLQYCSQQFLYRCHALPTLVRHQCEPCYPQTLLLTPAQCCNQHGRRG